MTITSVEYRKANVILLSICFQIKLYMSRPNVYQITQYIITPHNHSPIMQLLIDHFIQYTEIGILYNVLHIYNCIYQHTSSNVWILNAMMHNNNDHNNANNNNNNNNHNNITALYFFAYHYIELYGSDVECCIWYYIV